MKNIRKNFLIPAVLILSTVIFLIPAGCAQKSDITLDLTEENRADIPAQDTEDEGGAFTGESAKTDDFSLPEEPLYVYVHGAVKHPGVYIMEPGSRVYEAVEAAGGATGKAPRSGLNQAAKLSDGQEIYLPTEEELAEGGTALIQGTPGTGSGESSSGGGLVNINTASREELMSLKGIGESRAGDIISYREKNGGFKTIDEIKNVPGIKGGMFEKIRDSITV